MLVMIVAMEDKLDLLHSLSVAIPIIKPPFTSASLFTHKNANPYL